MKSEPTSFRILTILAITQIIGWGTVGVPSVVSKDIAADLHMSVSSVFLGTSVLYVLMGLCAPLLSRFFTRYGARHVMSAGSVIAAAGFTLLALSHGPILYFLAWTILGAAGAATLTTAAYIMLNETSGKAAKGPIGALMLVTGLSSSIFWPTTAFLSHAVGWRGACLIFAAAMILVCLPLYLFGLPHRTHAPPREVGPATLPNQDAASAKRGIFYMIIAAIALNAFVTYGLSALLIELLKAEGLSPAHAVAAASFLGVIQVSARFIDFLGGGRWDGITTGLVAGMTLPIALLTLLLGGGANWSLAAFLLLYGLASGALAVARATIPLVFYDQADYANASSNIALPLNLISALSPPLLAALLTNFGSHALIGLALICSCGAVPILIMLRRRRADAARPA